MSFFSFLTGKKPSERYVKEFDAKVRAAAQKHELYIQARETEVFPREHLCKLEDALVVILTNTTMSPSTEHRSSPYSKQARVDIRHQFSCPNDIENFDGVESDTRDLISKYLRNRLLLCLVILQIPIVFSVISLVSIFLGDTKMSNIYSSVVANSPMAIIVTAVLVLGRFLLGRSRIKDTLEDADKISLKFRSDWVSIRAESREYVSGIDRTHSKKRGIMARLYCVLLLWSGKRAEYYDRYSRIIAWKIHDQLGIAQASSLLIEFIGITLTMGLFLVVLKLNPMHVFIGTCLGLSFPLALDWFAMKRLKPSEVASTIRAKIEEDLKSFEHHYLEVGSSIESIINDANKVVVPNTTDASGSYLRLDSEADQTVASVFDSETGTHLKDAPQEPTGD